MDLRRLAEVRAGTAGEEQVRGTGYLASHDLVLTSYHVVDDGAGGPLPKIDVRLGHPGQRRPRHAATVAWMDTRRSLALLRIEAEGEEPAPRVRWGYFTGSAPVRYEGLGFPRFADYESGQGVESLGGLLPPLATGAGGAFILDQSAAPDPGRNSLWGGASGSAIFCEGLLVGVVAQDDRAFGNRRLHAEPVYPALADQDFARLIAGGSRGRPFAEPVELKEFMQPPPGTTRAQTPGSLLAADAEVVTFIGRGPLLDELTAWRDGPVPVSMRLIVGPGGQGKTRLAIELAARARAAGWAAGFIRTRLQAERSLELRDVRRLGARLSESTRPVLLIADYADAHPVDVEALYEELGAAGLRSRVRLVLLARAAGSWWDNLEQYGPVGDMRRVELPGLATAVADREDGYLAAAAGLARRLAELPVPAAAAEPGRPWDELAADLADALPDLSGERFGNALTLHMTALTNLLDLASGAPPPPADQPAEEGLVRHERSYLRRSAEKRWPGDFQALSSRPDPDDRRQEALAALDRALAGLILLGPCDAARASEIGALSIEDSADEVAGWLAQLYPPAGDGLVIGRVQPDRLAESLLGRILTRDSALLTRIAALARGTGPAEAALSVLARTAAHPGFTGIGSQASDLILRRPTPFAEAAPVAATTEVHAEPLRAGLVRLGRQDPDTFKRHVYQAADNLPDTSTSMGSFSASLTETLTMVLRPLADELPATFSPDLAMYLANLASRRADIGRRQAALAPGREAVALLRPLAEEDPVSYRPSLAKALGILTAVLGAARQEDAALASAQEAAWMYQQLAEADPGTYRQDLAGALSNLSLTLIEMGRRPESLAPARLAVDTFRELAEGDPDVYRRLLVQSLVNLAGVLGELGQHDAGLATAREATDIYRRLADADPDAYLPDLARSLATLARALAEADHDRESLAAAREAVSLLRALDAASPDTYHADLAKSLIYLATALAAQEQRDAALAAAREAAELCGPLAEAAPDIYGVDRAEALLLVAMVLGDDGQPRAALATAREAVDMFRTLAGRTPDSYRPSLAGALDTLAGLDREAGEADDAVAAAQESASLYRMLAAADPGTFRPRLAAALDTAGGLLRTVGRTESALAAMRESSRIYRQLADTEPGTYQEELASALEHILRMLLESDEFEAVLSEALAVARQIARLYRPLASSKPNAYLHELSRSLVNLANLEAASGAVPDPRAWLTRAAEQGDTDAQYSLGVYLTDLDPPELAAARAWWTRAAESGHLGAQHDLGILLGSIDPPDLAAARGWLTKAAEGGFIVAQAALGSLLAELLDPPQLAEARQWWTRAAEAGNINAQAALGWMLATGIDPPDLAGARTWLTRAATRGDTEAQAELGGLLAYLIDPPERDEARRWMTRAAEAGDVLAQRFLGTLLATLDQPEVAEARRWLAKAADSGDIDAQEELGTLLLSKVDPPDMPEARRWLSRAAEAGNVTAQYNLGALHMMADPQELAQARTWWTRAAEAGLPTAQFALGALLADALDPPEPEAARAWLTRAAQGGHEQARQFLDDWGAG